MLKLVCGLLPYLFVLTLTTSMPTMAQDTFVIVPDHPHGVPVNGCYGANRTLFGPYHFSFCLHRQGTYTVRGGGVACDGRLIWFARGRDIFADIQRTSCGGGVAWEAASMECRPAGRIFGSIGSLLISSLRCTYRPTVRHQRPQTFTADRL